MVDLWDMAQNASFSDPEASIAETGNTLQEGSSESFNMSKTPRK